MGKQKCLLTINGGSSSIKFAVFALAESPQRCAAGKIERIGLADAVLSATKGDGPAERRSISAPDHESAVHILLDFLDEWFADSSIEAVGHRIVHGGPRFHEAVRITPAVLDELRNLVQLAPEHLPSEIKLIEALQGRLGAVPQVARFDTGFHATMPRVAQLLPLPRRYEAQGVRRYGFHGLSFTYLLEELRRVSPEEAKGRLIFAHLGNGASMAAVRDGRCIDTSMAFTPAAGLVMSTRTGDFDPGLVWYLLHDGRMTVDEFYQMVNRQSGLLGVSEISSDMRDLLVKEADDVRAAEAVELFCYQARKWIGAYAAALAGLDTVVFTAGIGENAPDVRRRICAGLQFLGIEFDERRNAAGDAIISSENSRVKVRVIGTDEEAVIARATYRLI